LAIEPAKWAAPRRASAPGPLAHTPAPTGRFTRGFAAGEGWARSCPTTELFPRADPGWISAAAASSAEAVEEAVHAEGGVVGRAVAGQLLAAHEGAADGLDRLGTAALDQDDPPGGLVRPVAQLLFLAGHAGHA